MVLHQRQEAVVQQLRRLVHAAVHLRHRAGEVMREAMAGQDSRALPCPGVGLRKVHGTPQQAGINHSSAPLLLSCKPAWQPGCAQPQPTLTPRAGSSNVTGSKVRFTRQWSRLSLPCSAAGGGGRQLWSAVGGSA